ncbi:hypothetical protein JCGZ_20929 [Jatropha curcas]|uniref:Pentacotripeptide-repeat region of PRORP domain-containing protein n=1 Tax=Jatropha curcas TaxID=180498 RepID=A0A067LI61_JATCU|nr:hypothetical protein JCGZ_20929 [Jatropha curcas]
MAQLTQLRVFFKQALLFQSPSIAFTTTRVTQNSLLPPLLLHSNAPPLLSQRQKPFNRLFCSGTATDENGEKKTKPMNTKVNFSLSDSDSESDHEGDRKRSNHEIDRTKLPPPYDPFDKKPAIEEPEDPKDLQSVFHKMRAGGLMNNAVKMFDALSKDGLTHEALQLFSEIKDKGHMPEVIAHTAVIEAYANAGGQSKEAHKVFLRMLANGIAPNAYTYTVLIKGLSNDGKLVDAKKYLLEMMGKGMRPNAGTYTAVFEAFAKEEKVEEAKELLKQMKERGFVPDEKAVKEVVSNKRGQVFRTVINVLFNK